ncbi:MAG: hypothetical protein J4G04_04190 [Nitrosopumilaceae archaeon]|nr:hypothetical protein [Nitrosopumilaceae archaeon]
MLSCLLVAGAVAPSLGAQLEIELDPSVDSAPFKMTYQRTVFIEYEQGGNVATFLDGTKLALEGAAGPEDPAVQRLAAGLNEKIRSDRSLASVDDLSVEYGFYMTGRDVNTSLDFRVVLTGNIVGYVIVQDQQKTLVDLGWRGLSLDEPVVIDGVDVNIPLNILRDHDPAIYELVRGTDAGRILSMPLINADFILEMPMARWHFLFDPTGIIEDSKKSGLSDELAGRVISGWSMGTSDIFVRQVEREWSATVDGVSHPDIPGEVSYDLVARQAADSGNIHIVGFGSLDTLDGVEIAGVTAEAPEGFGDPATGDFPVFIIYGMAGMAAVGGGAFFMFSNRALKNEKRGQQGIDPRRLVSHQTSAASGGYQTNRGEAHLRDFADYQQTRSYYERAGQPAAQHTPPPAPASAEDAACACAVSAGMDSECDCQVRGSCLCDAACGCPAETCREYAGSM